MDATEQVGEIPAGRVGLLALRPYLFALTPASRQALGGKEILIPFLPFRVGREWRKSLVPGGVGTFLDDRRKGTATPNNDLYIREPGQMKHISREHFLIEQRPGGGFFLVDRGRSRGTLVAG
ncbi:MAG: FHA domain-containing protein, partial [Candidatus Binatia bacterium]